jgi:CheY-like chemotaxis protein
MEKNLLLIDDDPDELAILMDVLQDSGLNFKYNVAQAPEALKILQRLAPDYILLDYNMPKMNGLECLAEIKQIKQIAHVPVIMYSGAMDDEQVETAMALGAAGHIKKPYDMRMLPSLLNPFL